MKYSIVHHTDKERERKRETDRQRQRQTENEAAKEFVNVGMQD